MLSISFRPLALCFAIILTSGTIHARDWFDRHPRSLAVAADGVTVATACADKFVRIWNTTDGKLTHKIALDQPGRSITFIGSNGDFAVGDSGGTESTLSIWKLKDGKYTQASKTKVLGMVTGVAASPDGKWVVAVTVYGHIDFIDATEGVLRRVWQESGNGIHDVAFSTDGKTLYTAGQAFRAWDVKAEDMAGKTATARNLIPADELERVEKKYLRFQTGNATAVAPLPEQGKVIAIGCFANRKGTSSDLALVEGAKGDKKTLLSDAMGAATFITASPDGKTLAIGFNNDHLELWDIRTGRKSEVKRDGIGWLRAGVFLGDGKRMVITNDDSKKVEVIELPSGKIIKTLSQ